MLFHSLVFVLFAGIFYLVWPWVRDRDQPRWWWLTAMSFLFYGWWDWRFLLLILASGGLDFSCGLAMARWPERRGRFLMLSLLGNLGSLGVFKYLDFFLGSIDAVVPGLGIGEPFGLTLPVGISFYTFQSMSYTIDVYRGRLTPTASFAKFMAYLSMFPQLVAGPIVRASDLLPQLDGPPPEVTEEARFEGTRWLVHGYFKKAVIADNLAPFVEAVFSQDPGAISGMGWWLATLAFHFQIYCDFSGYSDIARGLARWMGFEFPNNFDHPYVAGSIQEFWRRWHQSLSSWFQDYVFIPLGGSRGTTFQVYRNLWVTFLLSGLWHGAAWNYVFWAAVHAACLSIERATRWPARLQALRGGRWMSILLTWLCLQLTWVMFRASTISDSLAICKRMILFDGGIDPAISDKVWIWMGLAFLRQLYVAGGGLESRWARAKFWRWAEPVGMIVLLWLTIFFRGPGAAFLYFQF